MTLKLLFAVAGVAMVGCGEDRFTWAFAQNIDNSFHPNEFCRESLAASIYANGDRTVRQGSSNVYLFSGQVESYRIYAFRSQSECEVALSGMVARQRK
jgi:hypothetical protein